MAFVARKPLRLHGEFYAANAPVPLDGLDPELRRRLVAQRRVVPRVAEPSAGASAKSTKKAGRSRRTRRN